MLIKVALILLSSLSFSACANTIETTNPPPEPNEQTIHIGDSTLDILFSDNIPDSIRPEFLAWISRSAETVSHYYDRFPVERAGINIIGVDEPGVRTGRAMQGTESPQLLVWVGIGTSPKTLESDWVMVHEMIHLATATLERRHRWLEEGLSVYIESISRAQTGELEPSRVWREFAKRMPNGQLRSADKGLDFTPRWGRTYWGGAVFFLLADIKIRDSTNNEYSLADALKNVLVKGLTMNTNVSIDTLIQTMDEALPSPEIGPLYEQYARQASPFPLEKMWKNLGVDLSGSEPFNDNAPLACVRQALTSSEATPC